MYYSPSRCSIILTRLLPNTRMFFSMYHFRIDIPKLEKNVIIVVFPGCYPLTPQYLHLVILYLQVRTSKYWYVLYRFTNITKGNCKFSLIKQVVKNMLINTCMRMVSSKCIIIIYIIIYFNNMFSLCEGHILYSGMNFRS